MLNIVNALWVYSDKTKWFIAIFPQVHVPLPHVFPPFAIRQSPTGRDTLGARTLSGVVSLCHSLRWCKNNHSAPATSYFRLVLGTRYGRRRCSSNSVFEGASAYICAGLRTAPIECQKRQKKALLVECFFVILFCRTSREFLFRPKHQDKDREDLLR